MADESNNIAGVDAVAVEYPSSRDCAGKVQSVCRAFDIIEMLAKERNGLPLSEISRRSSLKPPTAHNLLRTLVHLGYAENDGGRYRLGIAAFLLGRGFSRAEIVRRAAGGAVRKLVRLTVESAALGIWRDGGLVFIENIHAERELTVQPSFAPGVAHSTACGNVLLANLAREEIDGYMRKLELSAKETAALERSLRNVRRTGAARLVKPYGVSAAAAPIRDAAGEVIASIGISGPSVRLKGKMLRAAEAEVIRAAREISARLGFKE